MHSRRGVAHHDQIRRRDSQLEGSLDPGQPLPLLIILEVDVVDACEDEIHDRTRQPQAEADDGEDQRRDGMPAVGVHEVGHGYAEEAIGDEVAADAFPEVVAARLMLGIWWLSELMRGGGKRWYVLLPLVCVAFPSPASVQNAFSDDDADKDDDEEVFDSPGCEVVAWAAKPVGIVGEEFDHGEC